MEEVYEVKNGYSSLFYEKYGTEFPFWDETALFSVLDPSNVLNSTSCKSLHAGNSDGCFDQADCDFQVYLDVDTAYSSPYYGNIIGYQEALKPRAQTLQKVNFIYEVDGDKLKESIKHTLQYPKTCNDLA